jgi:hypothetical protein
MLITFTDNFGEIESALQSAVSGVTDWTDAWELLRGPWEARGREMFASKGASTGTPWPLYKDTVERNRYVYAKASILKRKVSSLQELRWEPGRERLYPSLTDTRDQFAVWDVSPLELRSGTSLGYAGSHNLGIGTAPDWAGGHVTPRRPLLGMSPQFVEDTRRMTQAIANAAAARATEGGRVRVGLTTAEVRAYL